MDPVRKISANIPKRLLLEATRTTGLGITEPLIQGLELVKRTSALGKAKRLQGRLNLNVDLELSRESARR
jgi:hypothetical protein